jgi:pyridoxamine--pyruvate transaminase
MMSTGPVEVSPRVLKALSTRVIHHSRPEFGKMYESMLSDLQTIWKTKNDLVVLHGEGVIGLESSVACMIDPGQKVIVTSAGVFGSWFKQLIESHDGVPVVVESDPSKEVDLELVKAALDENPDAALAVGVHGETVAGIVNPIGEICRLARKKGMLTAVDAIATTGGQDVRTDEWKVDLCIGASQHCLSAPPGLTQISVSPEAWEQMEEKKRPIRNSYLSVLDMKEAWIKGHYFPYTPLISEVYALAESCSEILEEGLENVFQRHHDTAETVRRGIKGMGLKLFATEERYALDVSTTLRLPDGVEDTELLDALVARHSVLLAGGFRELKGKIIRIGHSGYAATVSNAIAALVALETELRRLGYDCLPGSAVSAAVS